MYLLRNATDLLINWRIPT